MQQVTATPPGARGNMTAEMPVMAPPIKYCLYARKSTEQDEKQALSIDSQIKEMLQIAERDRLEVADIRKEAHSAKASGERPVYNSIIADIKTGKFSGVLTWAPDRLARNAGDLGALVDLMDQKLLIEIRTFGQKFTNSPNEKFLLMILGAQGKLENDQKGLNVQRGLRARCEMGLWPAPAPTGYLNEKNVDKVCHKLVDPKRGPIVRQMFEKVGNENWSGKKVYRWLKDDVRFIGIYGKSLSLSNVYLILKSTFYYGVFEYPKGSGAWYTGKHQPLITKELFDKVQGQLTRSEITSPYGSKEFAFTKLIICGICGAGISADEKFKKLKAGGVNRHVYYSCNNRWKLDCKCGSVKEEDLILQLLNILDTVKLDRIGVKEKLEKEMNRYRKFQAGVLGIKEQDSQKTKDLDIRNYAKYILREGTMYEKRELLSCMRSKLTMKNKKLTLEA